MRYVYRAVQEGNDDFFGDWRIQKRWRWSPFWCFTGKVMSSPAAQLWCAHMNTLQEKVKT